MSMYYSSDPVDSASISLSLTLDGAADNWIGGCHIRSGLWRSFHDGNAIFMASHASNRVV